MIGRVQRLTLPKKGSKADARPCPLHPPTVLQRVRDLRQIKQENGELRVCPPVGLVGIWKKVGATALANRNLPSMIHPDPEMHAHMV